MERPYELDTTGTWHSRMNDCEYICDGDGTLDGVNTGVAFCGEGICPDCFTADQRVKILAVAKIRIEQDH